MRRILLATALAAASIAVPTATGSVAEAQTTTSSNPWNVTVVRFAPGTTRAQMYTTVRNSGGVVATDLSQINALAVVSTNKAFRTDVKASSRVRACGWTRWSDPRRRRPALADGRQQHAPDRAPRHRPGPGPVPRRDVVPGGDEPRGHPAVGRQPDGRPRRLGEDARRPHRPRRRDRLRAGRLAQGAGSQLRQAELREHDPVQRPDPAVRPGSRPEGLLLDRHRGPRHLGRQPDRRCRQRVRLQRGGAQRPGDGVQGVVHDARRWSDHAGSSTA